MHSGHRSLDTYVGNQEFDKGQEGAPDLLPHADGPEAVWNAYNESESRPAFVSR